MSKLKQLKIRASALPGYFDCPRRSAAGIFKNEIKEEGYDLKRTPQNVAAAVGTGTHAAAQYNIDHFLDHGDPGKLDDGVEHGIIAYRAELLKGLEYDETTMNNGHAEAQIKTLTRSYFYEVLPTLDLVDAETEVELKAEFDGCLITGKSDFISATQLRDLKTGRVSDYRAQLGCYSLLNASGGFARPPFLANDFLARVPVGKPYPGARTIKFSVDDAEEVAIKTIKAIKRQAEEFLATADPWCFPANPKSMLCGPKYCPAFGTAFCKMGVEKNET